MPSIRVMIFLSSLYFRNNIVGFLRAIASSFLVMNSESAIGLPTGLAGLLFATAVIVQLHVASIAAQPPLPSASPTEHTILLTNAADADVRIPLAGVGMPCGPTYACSASSYNGTRTFLAMGGRHTDSAISYSGAEPGIGLAMREWMASAPATNKREDLFIGTKVGPGGACW